MGIEILLVLLAVTLGGGLFLALLFSYRESEVQREATAREERRPVPLFFDTDALEPVASDLVQRKIEHHVRHEILAANLFVDNPSVDTLWADRHEEVVQ